MKNNFKKILLNITIIIFSLIPKTYAIEQFTFDVTELEILDKGNKFKGLKRGTIISDNGIIIKSDFFEYDKLNNILTATGNVEINDTQNDYLIFSNNIVYTKNKETIFSKNVTKAIIESKYNFVSKNVTLLRDKNELYSSDNTEIIDDKQYFYKLSQFSYNYKSGLLKGKDLKVISNFNSENNENKDLYTFKDGQFNLKSKNFNAPNTKIYLAKNLFGNNKNDPRLFGVSSKKKNALTTVNKGVFTSCSLKEKCPPWSINAETILHDEIKKQLIYEKAFLNVYDVPVLYFPKFFHPDPTVKRQSGLLTPQINSSDKLGTSMLIPYYHVISDNKDLTFTPTIFDSKIYMLQNEFRQINKDSSFIIDLAHTQGFKANLSNNKNSISHIFAKYDLNLNLKKFKESKLSVNFEKITNDTYLKIFDTNLIDKKIKPKNQDQLFSNINVSLNNEKYFFSSGISIYEKLNGKNSDRYQFVLPYYNYSKNLLSNQYGYIDLTSNGYNDLQNTNKLKTSVINNLDFLSKNYFSKNGFKNNIGIYFKNLNTVGKNYSNYKSSPQSEIMSIYNLETSLPLIRYDDAYINYLVPKVSLRFNPGDMKNYSSSKRTIGTNNIFSINRLGIEDSFEQGKSITIGANYKKEDINDINKYFSFNLGSVFRDKNETKIPISSTIANKSSNLIGSSTFSISENYELAYNFSIDNNFNNFEYNNIAATYSLKNFMTKFNFIEENGKIGATNSIENTTEFKFSDDKYIYFNTRRNRETNLTEYYDLIYEYKNDCLTANIKYKKTYYQDRDLNPKEDLMLSITLFPITTYEQKIDQNFYRN